jgi:hypothetical protein
LQERTAAGTSDNDSSLGIAVLRVPVLRKGVCCRGVFQEALAAGLWEEAITWGDERPFPLIADLQSSSSLIIIQTDRYKERMFVNSCLEGGFSHLYEPGRNEITASTDEASGVKVQEHGRGFGGVVWGVDVAF